MSLIRKIRISLGATLNDGEKRNENANWYKTTVKMFISFTVVRSQQESKKNV